jgi:hypothetical protein
MAAETTLGNTFLCDKLPYTFMITDPESLVPELRQLRGVKDVEIVGFPSGKELWVVLGDPIDTDGLHRASASLGYAVLRSGSLASKLPRSLAEMIWDGTTHVVTKHPHGWKKLISTLGLRPAVKIARDLATGDTVYNINDSDGLAILREYLKVAFHREES